MAKFLKEYVRCISGNPKVKPVFYPALELQINKYLVKFFDDHEFILDLTWSNKVLVYFSYGVHEIDMKSGELKLVKEFLARLFDFGFLPGVDERGRSIADRIRGSEPRGAGSIPAGPASDETE